jgi:hypothetical protein
VSDQNPPQAFNWNLGPKKPGDPVGPIEPAAPDQATDPFSIFATPTQATQVPPVVPPPAPYVPPAPHVPTAPYLPPVPPVPSTPYADVPTQAYSFGAADSTPPPAPPSAPLPPATPPAPPTLSAGPPAAFETPFDASLGGFEALGLHQVGIPEPANEGGPATAIEALFGQNQFKEYESGVLPTESPFVALAGSGSGLRVREERQPLGRTQKILMSVAGGLVAALALVGIFLVGTKMSGIFAQRAAAVGPSAAPSIAAVTPEPAKVGPVAPGNYAWNALIGSECITPFTNAWANTYAVVDCATPHAAQLLSRGTFTDETYATYPGPEVLQQRIGTLCSSPKSIKYSSASKFKDIQISASYAATATAWSEGDHNYFCFASRESGKDLTASVAAVPSAGAITPGVPGNDP